MSEPSTLAGLRRAEPEAPVARVPEPQARKGTRVLLPVVLLVAFLGIVAFAARDALRPKRDVRVVPVIVRAGGGGAVSAGTVVATAAGWVEPDPFPVHVSALTNGVVEEVLVLEGETVEAGQVVARLVPDDARLAADRAQARVELAEAALRTAAAEKLAAETDWENPVALERAVAVTKAKLDEGRAERVRLDRDREVIDARIAELRDQFERAERAVETGAVSANETAQLRLQIATQKAARAALIAREDVLDAKIREAEADHAAAKRDYELRVELRRALDATRAAHSRAEADLQDARVALEEARLRLDRIEIRAPVAGVVMRRLTEPGSRLMLDMDMEGSSWAVDLYDPEKLQVRVDVALADAAQVGVGQKARVVVETLPDRTFPAEVSRIVHYADIQKNTVEVKVRLLETAPELKPEMLARVEVLAAEGGEDSGRADRGRVFAPERLVRGGTAWVVGAGGDTAERRSVALGSGRAEDWVEVSSGLRPGDRLIDAEAGTLTEGEGIRITGETTR
jgi:RND family efflux transporter MFP subunit